MKVPVLAAILCFAMNAFGENAWTADEHTLLLAHFDRNLDADHARGNAKATGLATIDAAGKFGGALAAKYSETNQAGLMTPSFCPVSYEAKGNLNPAKGTLEMWVKTAFDAAVNKPNTSGYASYYLFTIQDGKDAKLICFIHELNAKPESRVIRLYPFRGTDRENEGIVFPVGDVMGADKWTHLALTWDGHEMRLFVNGKGSGPLSLRDGTLWSRVNADTDRLYLGGLVVSSERAAGNTICANSLIDEVRISDIVRPEFQIKSEAPAPKVAATETREPTNLLSNASFESKESWDVSLVDGAAGERAWDTRVKRTGKLSLKLTKSNGLGFIRLTTATPIHVKPGVTYTFRGFFQSRDSPLSSLLLFRVGDKNDVNLSYDTIDSSAGWGGQSLLINSPPVHWEKRVITYKTTAEKDVYLHIALFGNPSTVWLDDLEFVGEVIKPSYSPFTPLTFPFSADQVQEILATRTNSTARVASRNGVPQLLLDGEPTLPVIYKGIDSDKISGDYEEFGKIGVPFAITTVRLGPSKYEQTAWKGKDQFDFKVVDERLLAALRKNPRANLIVDLWIYPYQKWGDENPVECIRDATGKRVYGWWANWEGSADDLAKVDAPGKTNWWYPSYQSARWREDAGQAVERVVAHIRSTPMGKSVVGFFITGGHDGTYVVPYTDFSTPTRVAFQEWCKRKYGSIDNVARVWDQKLTSFDAIEIPRAESPTDVTELTPPYVTGALPDFREFQESSTWELRDHFAAAAKKAIGKPVIVLSYGSPPPTKFFRLEHMDACGTMTYYPYRNAGYATGWKPNSAFGLHSKLFFQELDLRSWTGTRFDEVYQTWIGAGLTPESWNAIHRKLVGISLANDYGYWYYDMNRFFSDPRMFEEIRQTQPIAKRVIANQRERFRPDVAVIIADLGIGVEANRYLHVPVYNSSVFGNWFEGMMLETSGVPHDVLYLEDVLARPELQDYRVYVFLHNTFLSDDQRAKIRSLLQNRGRTLVWVHDTGYISEHGKSAATMSELFGMNVRTEETYARWTTQIIPRSNPLVRGVQPFQGANDLLLGMFSFKDTHDALVRYQPFWIEDPAATPVARYAENARTAMAVRKLDDWTSIYLATPNGLGNDLFNSIARAAGAYVCGDAGQSVHMNADFVSIHGMKNGRYTLRLPAGRSRVIDAHTGRVLAKRTSKFTFPVTAQETYWFFLE